MERKKTVIVGGGAAGLVAAVLLGRELHGEVLLLERLPRVGKKLLATGNGTCNITNIRAKEACYHGDSALAAAVIEGFSPADALRFYESVGVVCETRGDGKCYPRCEQAAAVLDCLRLAAAECGAELRCEQSVTAISPQKGGLRVVTDKGDILADTVLVCTGGAAAPSLGGSTDGYALLTALGHRRTPLFPAIVQLRTDTALVRAMKGLRVDAAVTVTTEKARRREVGEVLFTDYGLSGPPVLQVSRLAADWERQKRGACTVSLDLFPTMTKEETAALMQGRRAFPTRTMEDFFTGLLQKRVGQTVVRACGLPLTQPIGALRERDMARLTDTVKSWEFAVLGTQGFGGAQVTAGGIDTADFDRATLQSKKEPRLFAAGEMLNVDGDCGGFNLQFAAASAAAAARGILTLLKGGAV